MNRRRIPNSLAGRNRAGRRLFAIFVDDAFTLPELEAIAMCCAGALLAKRLSLVIRQS
jgi:hypothetical protein